MEFKIPKKQVILKISLAVLITLVVVYFLSAFLLVSNRVNYDLENTTWVSRKSDVISFANGTSGEYNNGNDELVEFTYTQSRGYIVCNSENESLLLELIGLKENRLYAVNMNIMFYDLKTLK